MDLDSELYGKPIWAWHGCRTKDFFNSNSTSHRRQHRHLFWKRAKFGGNKI